MRSWPRSHRLPGATAHLRCLSPPEQWQPIFHQGSRRPSPAQQSAALAFPAYAFCGRLSGVCVSCPRRSCACEQEGGPPRPKKDRRVGSAWIRKALLHQEPVVLGDIVSHRVIELWHRKLLEHRQESVDEHFTFRVLSEPFHDTSMLPAPGIEC